MTEKINRKDDRRTYQPRIRSVRIKDLYEMKVVTKRPMTVLLDEALSLYLAAFFSSEGYKAYENARWQRESEAEEPPEPNLDNYEDLSSYIDQI